VATGSWYIFNRPQVVHFGWPPRTTGYRQIDFDSPGESVMDFPWRDFVYLLVSLALGFAVLETTLFYAHGDLLINGYWKIFTPQDQEDRSRLSVVDQLILLAQFSVTPFVGMALRLPETRSIVGTIVFASFIFAVTLFTVRFVAFNRNILQEAAVALTAAFFSIVLETVSGKLAGLMPLIWFVAMACVVRYLLHDARLSHDDWVDCLKDFILISLVFLLAVAAYPNIPYIESLGHLEAIAAIAGTVAVAMTVVIWEINTNQGHHGTVVSRRKAEAFATELYQKGAGKDRVALLRKVRQGLLDHIMIRDAVGLFALVVVPFVILMMLGIRAPSTP
jgi:hypothetical protein